MTTTIREQIMTAIVAALGAAGAPAGLTVHRERTKPIETDSLPAILLYAEDETPKPWGHSQYRAPLTERQLTVVLECRAQGSLATPVDAALDPVYAWAAQRMFADVSFGGLANEVEEGRTAWQSKEGDVPVASCAIHFTVKYRTSRLDPTATNTN
jgi:hypothetical protein